MSIGNEHSSSTRLETARNGEPVHETNRDLPPAGMFGNTLRSLRKRINQFRKEITRFRARARF